MEPKRRKKKTKHLKINLTGSKTTAQIGSKYITFSVRIPIDLLRKRFEQ